MKNNPPVTVIMPAYNAEKFITEAIESILAQTFEDFELLIIDDGSTDNTARIIANYARKDDRIQILKNDRNRGICQALNQGIKKARGKYLARMDADDVSFPERLAKQIAFMEKNQNVVVCGSNIEVCDSNLKITNTREYPATDKSIRAKMFRLNPFAHPAVMMRSDAVKKAGGYNPALAGVEDYDLYFRLGRQGNLANLPDILLKLRTHPQSISSQNINHQAWLNLYVRSKAAFEYDYRPKPFDKAFFMINIFANITIPPRFKLRLHNRWRQIYC